MKASDGSDEEVMVSPGGRRRRPNRGDHKKKLAKKSRRSCGGKFPAVACTHTAETNSQLCHADKLTADDIVLNFSKFCDKKKKTDQDRGLLRLMTISPVKRRRKKVDDEESQKSRALSVKYRLWSQGHPDKVPVCKETFTKVLGVSKDRVSRVARYYAENDDARPERRGGARNVEENARRRQLIVEHIESFICHGRRGHPGRKYLPGNLNVSKMHELFEAQEGENTSYSLYYSVFSGQFNLGFGQPATEASGVCTRYRLRTRVKGTSVTEQETQAALPVQTTVKEEQRPKTIGAKEDAQQFYDCK